MRISPKRFLPIIAGLCISSAASAQTIWLELPAGYVDARALDITLGVPFEVATVVDTGGADVRWIEWVQSGLMISHPGVFRLSTSKHYPVAPCLVCEEIDGVVKDHLIECSEFPAPFRVMTVTYGDFSGVIGSDVVLTIRGFQPGDSSPSSFDGSPGFYDCDENPHPLEVSNGDELVTGSGVAVPSGAVVLNPTPYFIDIDDASWSRMKAAFR